MSSLAAESLTVKRERATLIDGVSLSLGPSGSVAVIGPNGAGKSTLLRTLAGVDTPTSGCVRLDGQDLAGLASAERAQSIGFLPQTFEPHWDLSVADLLELGAARATALPADAVAKAKRTFELLGLEARRWSTLSGGERARVLLATVLVVDPPVLIADEPSAALDIRHRLETIRTLAARGSERLSVVVVHDLDLAFRFFERVVLLVAGKVVADAPAHDLIHDPCLDEAFGVRFERLKLDGRWLLRADS
ncbi:MAG: ABC transporter ATP-binding protein [Alphaproteobacteria bacterium]|nr:ABC transporter ATP-binding protein [Alphaproteobacteria bacterium]